MSSDRGESKCSFSVDIRYYFCKTSCDLREKISQEMIFTINSDDEIENEVDEEVEETGPTSKKSKRSRNKPVMQFEFDEGRKEQSLRQKIENLHDDGSDQDSEADEDNVKVMPRMEERSQRAMIKKKSKNLGSEGEDYVAMKEDEADEEEDNTDSKDEHEYFDAVIDSTEAPQVDMFSQFTLSRPILRAIESMGYVTPTEVQAKVIPYALGGRDVCASALTGSGKTASFVIPFLERLLYRPKDQAAIRVIVVSPTRELASQTFEVVQKLAQYTDITAVLICGGRKDVKSQSVELRKRPDVVVGTPGRLIDHLMNTSSVRVDQLDVLVLDEVDRLLDLGFQDEIQELVKYCPKSRQTLLFSATMTSKVEDLAKLSLKRPIRVKTQGNASTTALRLVQEFVRLRKDGEREAILAAILCRTKMTRTIVFFETKKEAHRFQIVLSLLGTKAAEMHGDLPQLQRNHALQSFKEGTVSILIATDVASRGIDISGVHCVVNAEMPRSVSTYIHRVGRTARAGSSGRSVTVVSDGRRKVLKALLKGGDASSLSVSESGSQNILQRTVPADVVSQYIEQIAGLEGDIEEKMAHERENKQLDDAIMEAERAENLLLHEEEIKSRPSRSWYQSQSEKKRIAEASKEASHDALDTLDEDGKEVALRDKKERFVSRDEYLASDVKPRKHSVTRKKRRRDEALANADDEPVKHTGKKKLLAYRDKVQEISDKRDKEKKKTNKEAAAAQAAAKAAKRAKDIANGGGDDDEVKMHYKFLKKGGKAGKASFKSSKKYKRR